MKWPAWMTTARDRTKAAWGVLRGRGVIAHCTVIAPLTLVVAHRPTTIIDLTWIDPSEPEAQTPNLLRLGGPVEPPCEICGSYTGRTLAAGLWECVSDHK